MNDKNEKKELILQAIYVGIFLILLPIILFFIAKPNQNKRNEGLKIATQTLFNQKYPNLYQIDEFLQVKTPLTMSCAVFSLTKSGNKKTEENNAFAIIVRATGFAGAVPLVYVFDGNEEKFVGIAGNCGKIEKMTQTENAENAQNVGNAEKAEENFQNIDLQKTSLFNYGLNYKTIDFWQKRAKTLLSQCQKQGQI